ncbi:MAG: hypothetical protein EBR82_53905, partial [Caulobacteraceae bacterium]|nr:hypothetical protein [Caulobacteraceae bacterium]
SQASYIKVTNGPIVNSTGINALAVAHLCVAAAVDWTIAIGTTPPNYSGTVTIGNKSGGGPVAARTILTNIGTY